MDAARRVRHFRGDRDGLYFLSADTAPRCRRGVFSTIFVAAAPVVMLASGVTRAKSGVTVSVLAPSIPRHRERRVDGVEFDAAIRTRRKFDFHTGRCNSEFCI